MERERGTRETRDERRETRERERERERRGMHSEAHVLHSNVVCLSGSAHGAGIGKTEAPLYLGAASSQRARFTSRMNTTHTLPPHFL